MTLRKEKHGFMPKHSAGIKGLGIYVPDRIITNSDLETMVDTSDAWIQTRTGIRERHIVAENEASSDMAVEAARLALEDAGMKADDIDLILVTTSTPDMIFPSTA